MPYLILKIIGPSIMEKLLRYIYVLSIISLILFAFQLTNPSLFYSLSNTLNFMTMDEQTENGGWYIFIYMFSGWAPERNCGFMWEPGGYASILIIAMLHRLITNNFTIDKMIIVFTISLITTFSTAGYLVLFILIIAFYIKKGFGVKQPVLILLLIYLLYFIPNFYEKSDFLGDKIDNYIEQGVESWEHYSGIIRVSRLGIALIALDYSTHWPLGNGILESEFKLEKYGAVVGPNSLVDILTQWGWIGIIVYIIIFYKYFNYFNKSIIISILCLIALSIVLFSNPFTFKYIIYLLYFYTYVFLIKRNTINNDRFINT